MSDNTTAALVIKAAGGVIYRRDESGNQVFALVHKREYGEWCLPKGKLRSDEDWKEAAIRDVNEETGAPPRPTFTPSHEIDHVEWCDEAEVRRRLSRK